MITARHNKLYARCFDMMMETLLHRSFRRIHIHDNITGDGKSVLCVANHFSWWDGFIARYANRKTVNKKVFVMMLEDQLAKRPFLRKVGAFSIRKNTPSALESIQYASDVLRDPNHWLLLFPQGRFQSQHRFPLTFEKGWFRIAEKAPENTQVVFMASLPDYFEQRRPTLHIYLENAEKFATDKPQDPERAAGKRGNPFPTPEAAEEAYNRFLQQAIDKQERQAYHTI